MVIDGLQYANWSEKIFRQLRAGGVDAVHVTVAYHEDFPRNRRQPRGAGTGGSSAFPT
jgi:hypothetical protein